MIIDGREINDDTTVRVNDHADNIMTLSYYANHVTHIFLLDSFFAVIYLSFVKKSIHKDEFDDKFQFLAQLLEKEFNLNWDLKEVCIMISIVVIDAKQYILSYVCRKSVLLLSYTPKNKLFKLKVATKWIF